MTSRPFPYLLLPTFWSARNRARRREPGDAARLALFGGIGVGVATAIFAVVFWLTWQLDYYEELTPVFLKLTGGAGLQEIDEDL